MLYVFSLEIINGSGIAKSVLPNQSDCSVVSDSWSWTTRPVSDYAFFMEWVSFL